MSAGLVLFLVAASFCAGVVDAIAGGGGLLTVPALLAAGLPEQIAIPTNKGQACFGAVSSAVSFWRRGGVDRERVPLGFGGGFAGSLVGAALLLAIPKEPLRPLVLGLLLFAAGVIIVPRRKTADAPTRPLRHPRLALLLSAFLLGAYDGFFGPGTGTLLIVTFTTLFADTVTRASGNAKIVNLGSNLAAFSLFALRGKILWSFALPMAAANALGAWVGAHVAMRRGDRFVRAVVVTVALSIVAKLGVDWLRARKS